MKKIIICSLASIFLSQVFPVAAAPKQAKPKSFLQWCQQKESLPVDTKYTIDILLVHANTENCKKATRELVRLTNLNLDGAQIIDLKPLASLTNLTSLSLNQNGISDLTPLVNLINLTSLLKQVKIFDVFAQTKHIIRQSKQFVPNL
jgi:internalin A